LERSHAHDTQRTTTGSRKRIKVDDEGQFDTATVSTGGITSHSQDGVVAGHDELLPMPSAPTDATVATTVNDRTLNDNAETIRQQQQIERLRVKNRLRKERKKAKALERLQVAKDQQQRREHGTSKASKASDTAAQDDKEHRQHEIVHCRKGVQYQDIVVGKGPMVQHRKKIYVKYTLRKLNETGKIIDSSEQFGFRIGKGEVIEGWDIGLEGMKQGGIRHLTIPPEAGYGKKDIGAGKGGVLFFKVTLLGC
jgi:FK506-binding nuclear protein